MSTYSERYRTPSPLYPKPTATSLSRLLQSWETLRALDTDGYRTSAAAPPSTWLVDIDWEGRKTHRSPGRGTTCSPFTTQAIAITLSRGDSEPYAPTLADGRRLPFLFSQLTNGVLKRGVPVYDRLLAEYGATLADNTWPRPVIFFNIGRAVERGDLRRGDCVHIEWLSGGGHAVFVWDVHLNERGEVDAFQYVSANGKMAAGGSGGGIAVGGTTDGRGGFIRAVKSDGGAMSYQAGRTPLFQDDEAYVEHGLWVTWDPEVAARPLRGLRRSAARRPTLVKRILAARLFGIEGNEAPLFAMGEAEPRAASAPERRSPPLVEVTGSTAVGATSVGTTSVGTTSVGTTSVGTTAVGTANVGSGQEGGGEVGSDLTPASAPDIALMQKQLHLLAQLEWIAHDPGGIDGKLGPHTRRSLVAFQRAYGLEASGRPTPLSLERLAHIYQSALDDPRARLFATSSGPGGQAFSGPLDDEASTAVYLYFRHGVARAGDPLSVIATGALPASPFAVTLHDAVSGEPLPDVPPLLAEPLGQRAVVTMTVPPRAPGTRLFVRALGRRSEVPLLIVGATARTSGSAPAFAAEGAAIPRDSASAPVEIEAAVAQVLLGRRALCDVAAEAGMERDQLLRMSLSYSDAGRRAIAAELHARGSAAPAGRGSAAPATAFAEPESDREPRIAQTFVLSDLHLGNGGPYDCYAGGQELCRFLEREALQKPTRLLCNGDTVDFLLNDDPLSLERGRAVRQAQAAMALPENAAIFASFGRVLQAGGQVVIRLGNHDAELALPEVQAVLRAALKQPATIARGLVFQTGEDPAKSGGILQIGGAKILISHGEQNDHWNQLDYPRLTATAKATETIAAEGGGSAAERFEYPPGSRLVKRLLNPLKARYGMRFADLLKPDFQGAALTALAVNPLAVRTLLGGATLKILWQLHSRRAMAATFVDPQTGDGSAEPGEADLGLRERIRGAGLDASEAGALQALLQPARAQSFAAPDETQDPDGRSASSRQNGALIKILRAGLSAYAAGQRRLAGREGERFFSLAPGESEWSEAQRLASKYGVGAVLFGHSHAARFFADRDLLYLNTGTWIWLLQLPPADADVAVWTRYLEALRRDPGLNQIGDASDPATPRLLRRLHVARIRPQRGGGAQVALCEWLPEGGLVVLREAHVHPSPAASGRDSAAV
jgi:peptidoglycan hydrolase-like protein with peptidoglycan-binding domain/UDP-2,3-diacylglucosamine pyrophosphatase LpxH